MKIEINNEVVDGILNNFLDKCGNALISEAKIQVPIRTGALRNSIEVKDKNYIDKKVLVGSDLPYAIHVEMGHMTKKGDIVQPQPYLRVALDMLPNNLKA